MPSQSSATASAAIPHCSSQQLESFKLHLKDILIIPAESLTSWFVQPATDVGFRQFLGIIRSWMPGIVLEVQHSHRALWVRVCACPGREERFYCPGFPADS